MNNPYAIYKFSYYCRAGELTGIFCAEKAEVRDIIGLNVYFGEVLGKHSDVSLTMQAEMFEMVTDDINVINVFNDNNLSCGYNPLSYYDLQYGDDDDY